MQIFRNTIDQHEATKKRKVAVPLSRNQGRIQNTKTFDPYLQQARSIIKEEVTKLEDLQA